MVPTLIFLIILRPPISNILLECLSNVIVMVGSLHVAQCPNYYGGNINSTFWDICVFKKEREPLEVIEINIYSNFIDVSESWALLCK